MAVPDQRQRDRALRADRSVIVQAPAGSGKTELLTQRFLRLLSLVGKPEQVLAITFTRKATQEMRERILKRLRQANEGNPPDAGHEGIAVGFAREALARDRDRGWNLLDNPGRLQIHTIDGLCARIAARSPLAGGASGLSVTEDAAPLYRKAAQRLIEDLGRPAPLPRYHQALARVLTHLHGDTGLLLAMLSGMLARRDQWLKRMGVEYADLQQVLRFRQEFELERLEDALGAENIRTLNRLLLLLTPFAEDQAGAAAMISALEGSLHTDAGAEGRTRAVLSALRAVATTAGTPFSPRSANGKVLPGAGDGRDGYIESLREVLAAWYGDPVACEVFRRFVTRPPLEDHADGSGILEDFQLLLKAAAAELEVFFIEAGQADFQYFAELAMRALGEDFQPGDALLIEDGRLAHILMDEFQDTSHTQYLLLERLISGWQPDDGRTLFLVGDPMQSIYRFRQADVRLFSEVFETGRLGDVELEPLVLSSNFRSRKELVDWVNRECERIIGPGENCGPGAVRYAAVQAARDPGGSVNVFAWPEQAGDEAEAQTITDLIGDRLKVSPEADIAVLTRKRSQLAVIADAMQKAGIDFDAVNVELLKDRPVVLDLLALMRAILHAGDRIAWLALLRAPWCGLTARQLHLLAGDDATVDLFARMSDRAVLEQLPVERARRVDLLRKTMTRMLEMRGKAPLHRLVETAWISCKGPYAAASQLELDNAQSFLDLLAAVEEEQPDDLLTTLEERLENHYSGSRAARVQLMTIHKAKGLEFDTVILPGLHKSVRGGEQPLLRLHELRVGHAQGVMMAPLERRGHDGDSLYGYLGQLDREEEALEARRTLYVAVTRAREELFLFGGWRMTGRGKQRRPGCIKGTFMDMFWPCFEPAIEPDAPGEPGAQPAGPEYLPQLRLSGEPDIAVVEGSSYQVEGVPELRLPDRNAVALGEALHLWLELIHDHWEQGWDAEWFGRHGEALAATLRRFGASQEQLPALVSRLAAMLGATLESSRNRAIVSPDGKTGSWAELVLYSRDGVHLRRNILDRLFCTSSGDFVVVDYKTGSAGEEAYTHWQSQLIHYQALVEQCTGNPLNGAVIYEVGIGRIVDIETFPEADGLG